MAWVATELAIRPCPWQDPEGDETARAHVPCHMRTRPGAIPQACAAGGHERREADGEEAVGRAERSDGDEHVRQVSGCRHGGWRVRPSVSTRSRVVSRISRPRADAGHHHTALPVADAARPYRLSSAAPSVGRALQRRPPVTPVPDFRYASLTASRSASAARCRDPPWMKGGGMVIAPSSQTTTNGTIWATLFKTSSFTSM
jgi:hypothetical protein